MRISDWSSDVCSSDLARFKDRHRRAAARRIPVDDRRQLVVRVDASERGGQLVAVEDVVGQDMIGRADLLEQDRALMPVRGDRKCVVSGKSVSVRVALGGGRILNNKKKNIHN